MCLVTSFTASPVSTLQSSENARLDNVVAPEARHFVRAEVKAVAEDGVGVAFEDGRNQARIVARIYSRSASWMSTNSPLACSKTGAEPSALPMLLFMQHRVSQCWRHCRRGSFSSRSPVGTRASHLTSNRR